MKTSEKLRLADQLLTQWDENEETMGQEAALHVACEQLGLSFDAGIELLAFASDWERKNEGDSQRERNL